MFSRTESRTGTPEESLTPGNNDVEFETSSNVCRSPTSVDLRTPSGMAGDPDHSTHYPWWTVKGGRMWRTNPEGLIRASQEIRGGEVRRALGWDPSHSGGTGVCLSLDAGAPGVRVVLRSQRSTVLRRFRVSCTDWGPTSREAARLEVQSSPQNTNTTTQVGGARGYPAGASGDLRLKNGDAGFPFGAWNLRI